VSLNTFHGPADWHSIVDQPTLDAIWDHHKSYRKPFTLNPPAITDVNADAVIESEASVLEKLTLDAAWPTITKKVYDQLCPNILGNPASVIQAIHQVTRNAEGEEVTLSVEHYFTSVQRMTNFLPTRDHRRDPTFPDASARGFSPTNEGKQLLLQCQSFFNGSLLSADEPSECLRSSVYCRDSDQSSPQDRSGYGLSAFLSHEDQSIRRRGYYSTLYC
jgi:hypothetical protein